MVRDGSKKGKPIEIGQKLKKKPTSKNKQVEIGGERIHPQDIPQVEIGQKLPIKPKKKVEIG